MMMKCASSSCPLASTLVVLALFGLQVAKAQLIWSEEFDTWDSAVWSYDLGAGGWGNQELQEYTSNAVTVENGVLKITAVQTITDGKNPKAPRTYTYTSGRIHTENKFTFQYGIVEARMQIPDLANGLWPAFWMMGYDFSTIGWPQCGELDIMEMGYANAINEGVVNQRVGSTAHWEANGNYAGYGLTLDAVQGLNDGQWHVFTMEWDPFMIYTYLDGVQIWAFDIANPNNFDGEEFHKPYFLLLNMAVGGTFTGIYNGADVSAPFPAEFAVDYIRIYDNGYTILGDVTSPSTAPSPPTTSCFVSGTTCSDNDECCSSECTRGRNRVCA